MLIDSDIQEWRKLGLLYSCDGEKSGFFKSHSMRVVPLTLPSGNIRLFYSSRCEQDMMHPTFLDVSGSDLFKILHVNDTPLLKVGDPGLFDDSGITIGSISKIKNEYFVYYTGWKRRRYGVSFELSIGVAKLNDDLKTMTKLSNGPIIGQNINNPYLVGGPFVIQNEDGTYCMYYCSANNWIQYDHGPEPIYTVYRAESKDGLAWDTSNNNQLIPFEFEGEVISAPWVFKFQDFTKIYYCYRGSNDKLAKQYRIGSAITFDGKSWKRIDKIKGLEKGFGDWDNEMMCYPALFHHRKKLYMFYSGNGVGKGGFGLAEAVFK